MGQSVSAKAMQSSELARLTGVSTDTLRYYERNKLLAPAQRSSSGYRLFPPEALVRVQMIRGALSVPLDESCMHRTILRLRFICRVLEQERNNNRH
jgi:MerR family regulatory protein